MKKIPTLFKREFEGHKVVGITQELTEPRMKNLFTDPLDIFYATIKWDGSCCAIARDGDEWILLKRYDAKHGKPIPENAIPCCDPDPVTGHQPCWMVCDRNNPGEKWFWAAFDKYKAAVEADDNQGGTTDEYYKSREHYLDAPYTSHIILNDHRYMLHTFEAVGKHFQGNPYNLDYDVLIPHGNDEVDVERSFEGIKKYLTEHYIEGLVFWCDYKPVCKIKRTDFGLEWNGKR